MPALIYPIGLIACIEAGGLWYWALVPLNLVMVPLADHALRRLARQWRPGPRLLACVFAEPVLWVYAGAQAAALGHALATVRDVPMSAFAFIGLVSSTGIMTGTAGITAAHELIHRPGTRPRSLGLALLAMVCYLHFAIEHLLGHHRRVGTADDPGTAQRGESFPRFFARALMHGQVEAWRLEAGRLRRRGSAVLGVDNRMLRYWLLQSVVLGAVWAGFGSLAVIFFALQSLMAVHLLEGVNYVQHYGLQRCRDAGGKLARVGHAHAWDSDYRISELITFHLTRHSDHHVHAGRPGADLALGPDSPKLPYSFFLMVFVALFPPWWRALMDHRVVAASPEGAP